MNTVISMDAQSFHTLADKQLHILTEALETADEEGLLEVDSDQGIITITLKTGRQYVINKHAPTQQIWLSSPVSGASHFAYDEGAQSWRLISGITLEKMLQQELLGNAQVVIRL